MVYLTVQAKMMKDFAIHLAEIILSSANQQVVVYQTHGFVTRTTIVRMEATKIKVFATTKNVIIKLSSNVQMENVYPNCGSAMETTIVTMGPMRANQRTSRLISVGYKTVQQVGLNVHRQAITGAFQAGCFAMKTMIAMMPKMVV